MEIADAFCRDIPTLSVFLLNTQQLNRKQFRGSQFRRGHAVEYGRGARWAERPEIAVRPVAAAAPGRRMTRVPRKFEGPFRVARHRRPEALGDAGEQALVTPTVVPSTR
jgi:hypothetical protein